jgi:protein-S-isoprenylcysteine O-methyltransferase Ste14
MSDTESSHMDSLILSSGRFFFHRRNLVFPLVFLALVLGLKPAVFNDPTLEIAEDIGGLIMALAGSGLRLWTIGLVYIKRGGVNKKIYADRLVTTGMFGVSRNPLYLGNALVMLGLLVAIGNITALAIGVAFFGAVYASIIVAEERYLHDKFGDEYAAYCARVPRLWPDFSLYRAATRGMTFNWRRAIQKDYSSIGAWIIAFLVYEAVEVYLRMGDGVTVPDLGVPAAGILAVLVVLLAIRTWKKRNPAR